MAQGYKGFQQIAREADRRIRERMKENEHTNMADFSFTEDPRITKKADQPTAFPLKELYDNIHEGRQIERLPELIEGLNSAAGKAEKKVWKYLELNTLIESKDFRKNLHQNLWELIPEGFKKFRVIKPVEWKADPTDNGLRSIVDDFVGKETFHQALYGVNFNQEGIVATNARYLIFLSAPNPKKQGIFCITKWCFKQTRKEGAEESIIDEKYPGIKSILPVSFHGVKTVSTETLLRYAHVLLDTGIVAKPHYHGKMQYNDRFINVNISMLKNCAVALLQLGIPQVDMGFNGSDKAIVFAASGQLDKVASLKTNFLLLMPQSLTGDELHHGELFLDLNDEKVYTYGVDNSTSSEELSQEDEELMFEAYVGANEINDVDYAWEMPGFEYQQIKAIQRVGNPSSIDVKDKKDHERFVRWAVQTNQHVPTEVLEEYPDLLPETKESVGKPVTTESTLELLTGNAWFKAHPEKIIGEPYTSSNRFNRAITKIRGTLQDVVDGIEVPEVIPAKRIERPESELNEATQKYLNDPGRKENIEQVLQRSRKVHAEKSLKRLKGEDINQSAKGYYSFDEIVAQYNKSISIDEIKAWLWYKRKSGGINDEAVILKPDNGWSQYVVSLGNAEPQLKQWLEAGIVAFMNGSYIPSVLYYAENISERLQLLEKEKAHIINTFGQTQYDRQLAGLRKVQPEPLTLADPIKENRIFIKPLSNFAQDQQVSALADGTRFKAANSNNIVVQSPVSLLSAFKAWLDNLPKTNFKKATSYDITYYYLDGRLPPRHLTKEDKLRLKQVAQSEGDLFFARFLAEALLPEDQARIEKAWNDTYNSYVEVNYLKVPIGFSCSATFKNKPLVLRKAQREGLGFIAVHGSGCIAYDVGLGKTMTAILSIAQAMEMGQCKRPLIVVPNQTYNNWLNELRGVVENGNIVLTGLLPQYQVNDLFNLSMDYIQEIIDETGQVQPVAEKTISVLTYEGFNRLAFNKETWREIGNELMDILNQGQGTVREDAKLAERISTMMGRGLQGGMFDIEDLGFDYITIDEAHAAKKSFTRVKGEMKDKEGKAQRQRSPYQLSSGEPSMIALRGFMISQYILRNNRMRNVVLLSATPFTNSPLEIYSMLALIGYQQLEQAGVKNLKQFFDTFIRSSLELVINAKLMPERKEVVLGFNNLIALQQLIFRFILYKSGEEAGIQRPNKVVLPRISHIVDGKLVPLDPEDQISTNLPMTAEQRAYMKDLEDYILGRLDYKDFCINPNGLEDNADEESGELLNEADLSKEEGNTARILRALTLARQITISPYLYSCNPDKKPSYKDYVENSPKLWFVMEAIRSVKEWHQQHGEAASGQIIYMNAGVDYFPLIKDYLVKIIGFDALEIGIISGGMSAAKKAAIADRFNAGEIKVLIGSGTIREGMNLQARTSVIYVCWVDWNPTDVKQLEGRGWRYGNMFANIRIVIPLMENSIDTFIFQKQQEKTSRINEIWYRAGRSNALNLEELNPAELKMGLVTDPTALARLMLLQTKEAIEDQIVSLENQKLLFQELANQRDQFNKNIGHIKQVVQSYKPMRGDVSRNTDTLIRIFGDYLDDQNSDHTYQDEATYDIVRKANAAVKRGIVELLTPRGIEIGFDVNKVTGKIDEEIKRLKEEKESTTGEMAVEAKAREIIKVRLKSGYRSKSVTECVAEFASLNDKLLSEKMVYDGAPAMIEKVKKRTEIARDTEEAEDSIAEMEALLRDMEEMDALLEQLEQYN